MVLTNKQKFNKKYGFKLNEPHSKCEIARLSKISCKQADAIIKKGEGAFRTNPQSVRPFVKNATQWGFSRLYSAVMNGKSARIDAKELAKGRKEFREKNKRK